MYFYFVIGSLIIKVAFKNTRGIWTERIRLFENIHEGNQNIQFSSSHNKSNIDTSKENGYPGELVESFEKI